MLFNRHFIILTISILFIGVIVWWQRPDTAVIAMANGDDTVHPNMIIQNYWERQDYRQINLADAMTADMAKDEHKILTAMFAENPFLSVQSCRIERTPIRNNYVVTVSLGSAIDERKELSYKMQIDEIDSKWMITNIEPI